MRFGLTDEQRLLDESVRRFLAERLPIARVREQRDAGRSFDAGAWKELAELGVVGCLVPEAFGGAGLGVFEAAVIVGAIWAQKSGRLELSRRARAAQGGA